MQEEAGMLVSLTLLVIFCSLLWRRTRIEVILQDDCRRRSVELYLPFSPVLFADRQTFLRFVARQPLVARENRHREARREQGDHHAYAPGLLSRRAVETARQ